MKKEALIQNPENPRRHIVLLGAGASRAAFPNGEGTGKHLPLMSDFAKTLPEFYGASDKIIEDPTKVVKDWRKEANAMGISIREQDQMARAFHVGA